MPNLGCVLIARDRYANSVCDFPFGSQALLPESPCWSCYVPRPSGGSLGGALLLGRDASSLQAWGSRRPEWPPSNASAAATSGAG
jgi:hypothetical protein